MTPADPSLLAQLRGFSDWMRRSESDHRVRFANGDYVGDYGYANALKDARELLTAVLEAQPPETAPTQMNWPPVGTFNMIDVMDRLVVLLRESVKRDRAEPLAAYGCPNCYQRADKCQCPPTPTSDPRSPVSAEADIIADQEARWEATHWCGDRLPIVNAATQEVTHVLCVLDKGHGGAEHVSAAGIHRWPRRQSEALTPTPPDVVCAHGTAMDVHCCNGHSGFLFDADSCVCKLDERPADTPTGLAPLSLRVGSAGDGWRIESVRRFTDPNEAAAELAELDAQRQASASVRREALTLLEFVDALEDLRDVTIRRAASVNINDDFGRVRKAAHEADEAMLSKLLMALYALRDAPRVSPRPPSGGTR